MEWIKSLNQSIEYIEEHLTEEIDLDQLAKIACCSSSPLSADVRLYGRRPSLRIRPQAAYVPGRGGFCRRR